MIVTQTADPRFRDLDFGWFPELALVFDGRNSLRDLALPPSVAYHGIGVPPRPRRPGGSAARHLTACGSPPSSARVRN